MAFRQLRPVKQEVSSCLTHKQTERESAEAIEILELICMSAHDVDPALESVLRPREGTTRGN